MRVARDQPIKCVLSIAGSDSSGGAGIQADLKAFAACGVHGMTAITAITAQNTLDVTAVLQVPGEIIEEQIAAVACDIGIDAVKIGMVGGVEPIEAVARALNALETLPPVVIDPVMASESGAPLIAPDAVEALIEQLFPLATVITPNLHEARMLALRVSSGNESEQGVSDEQEVLARALHTLGPTAIVVTGGHTDEVVDLLYDGSSAVRIDAPRYAGNNAHGSGCTHSSVMAARLARGDTVLAAAKFARSIAGLAVRDGLSSVGAGPGPVDVLSSVLAIRPAR